MRQHDLAQDGEQIVAQVPLLQPKAKYGRYNAPQTLDEIAAVCDSLKSLVTVLRGEDAKGTLAAALEDEADPDDASASLLTLAPLPQYAYLPVTAYAGGALASGETLEIVGPLSAQSIRIKDNKANAARAFLVTATIERTERGDGAVVVTAEQSDDTDGVQVRVADEALRSACLSTMSLDASTPSRVPDEVNETRAVQVGKGLSLRANNLATQPARVVFTAPPDYMQVLRLAPLLDGDVHFDEDGKVARQTQGQGQGQGQGQEIKLTKYALYTDSSLGYLNAAVVATNVKDSLLRPPKTADVYSKALEGRFYVTEINFTTFGELGPPAHTDFSPAVVESLELVLSNGATLTLHGDGRLLYDWYARDASISAEPGAYVWGTYLQILRVVPEEPDEGAYERIKAGAAETLAQVPIYTDFEAYGRVATIDPLKLAAACLADPARPQDTLIVGPTEPLRYELRTAGQYIAQGIAIASIFLLAAASWTHPSAPIPYVYRVLQALDFLLPAVAFGWFAAMVGAYILENYGALRPETGVLDKLVRRSTVLYASVALATITVVVIGSLLLLRGNTAQPTEIAFSLAYLVYLVAVQQGLDFSDAVMHRLDQASLYFALLLGLCLSTNILVTLGTLKSLALRQYHLRVWPAENKSKQVPGGTIVGLILLLAFVAVLVVAIRRVRTWGLCTETREQLEGEHDKIEQAAATATKTATAPGTDGEKVTPAVIARSYAAYDVHEAALAPMVERACTGAAATDSPAPTIAFVAAASVALVLILLLVRPLLRYMGLGDTPLAWREETWKVARRARAPPPLKAVAWGSLFVIAVYISAYVLRNAFNDTDSDYCERILDDTDTSVFDTSVNLATACVVRRQRERLVAAGCFDAASSRALVLISIVLLVLLIAPTFYSAPYFVNLSVTKGGAVLWCLYCVAILLSLVFILVNRDHMKGQWDTQKRIQGALAFVDGTACLDPPT